MWNDSLHTHTTHAFQANKYFSYAFITIVLLYCHLVKWRVTAVHAKMYCQIAAGLRFESCCLAHDACHKCQHPVCCTYVPQESSNSYMTYIWLPVIDYACSEHSSQSLQQTDQMTSPDPTHFLSSINFTHTNTGKSYTETLAQSKWQHKTQDAEVVYFQKTINCSIKITNLFSDNCLTRPYFTELLSLP